MHIIIGLGNPEVKYIPTRHNIGYWVVDELSELLRIPLSTQTRYGIMGQGSFHGDKVVLVKPTTYMNSSGICVLDMMQRFQVPVEQILVAYDDMDLSIGALRIRMRGGPGTHNGMKSIVENINSENFPRMRIGIGRPDYAGDTIEYVLGVPQGQERELLMKSAQDGAEAIRLMLVRGLDVAMQHYNRTQSAEAAPDNEV